jgi:hypothetical protein
MSLICEYCDKSFNSKSNLIYHQKNTKYCLDIQGINIDEFFCNFCDKRFVSKYTLSKHIEICKEKKATIEENKNTKMEILEKDLEKYRTENLMLKKELNDKDKIIDEKNQKIEKLENQLFKIAEKPTHTHNNTTTNNNQRYQQQIIQNLIPILDEHYDQIRDNLTEEHIKRGVDGYADATYDFMKDKIACTDFSRRILTYKDEKGNIIKDPKMNVFTKKIFTHIQPKCDELTQNCVDKIIERLDQATRELCIDKETMDDNDILIFERETDKILEEKKELVYLKNDINEIVQGKDNSLKSKYIEKICNKVYSR